MLQARPDTTMASSHASACLVALLVTTTIIAASAQPLGQLGGWVEARATYYGTDAWSIHTGECGFGFICPQRWTGGPQVSIWADNTT